MTTASVLAIGSFALPPVAFGHGLVQRGNLPLPAWLFAWAAAIVLVASFFALAALWTEPKLERSSWRPLPIRPNSLLMRFAEASGAAIGIFLLIITIASGLLGPRGGDNFAPIFVFIVFWVGLALASAVFGDVFRALNPWRALGRIAGWALRAANRDRSPVGYPARLGQWPAFIGLLGFTWIELVSGWGDHPRTLAIAIVVYSLYTFLMQSLYGVETWTRHGETFSVYFHLLSRISPLTTGSRSLAIQTPLRGLPPILIVPGTVAFVLAMIGTVTFDGLTQGALWTDVATSLSRPLESLGIEDEAAERVKGTIGLLASVALVAGFYALGVAGAATSVRGFDSRQLRRSFVHSLVPIAFAYAAAHYILFLLLEGQGIFIQASDPFDRGWDLFGTAGDRVDLSLVSQSVGWYFGVIVIIVGHVAGLILAHDRALTLYEDPEAATRSQYWMLAVMVGFTSLALWLLAQAGTAG